MKHCRISSFQRPLETAFREVLKNVLSAEAAEIARLKAEQTAELERVRSQAIAQIKTEWLGVLDSSRKGHRAVKPGSRSVSLPRKLGVLGSLRVHCALLNVKGFFILPNNYRTARLSVRAVEVSDIDLEPAELRPEVDGRSEAVAAASLRDAFRIAWREGGITSDPCFHTNGEYVIR